LSEREREAELLKRHEQREIIKRRYDEILVWAVVRNDFVGKFSYLEKKLTNV